MEIPVIFEVLSPPPLFTMVSGFKTKVKIIGVAGFNFSLTRFRASLPRVNTRWIFSLPSKTNCSFAFLFIIDDNDFIALGTYGSFKGINCFIAGDYINGCYLLSM